MGGEQKVRQVCVDLCIQSVLHYVYVVYLLVAQCVCGGGLDVPDKMRIHNTCMHANFFATPTPLACPMQFGSLMALEGGQRGHTYVHSLTFNCSRILIVCRLTLFCIHIGHGQGWGAATTQTTYCQTVYFLTLINFQTHNCLLLNFLLIGIVSRCFEIGLFKAVKIADQVGSKYLGQRSVIVHFRNGRTTALKWRTSRMHQMKIIDFTDKNI